MCSAAGGQPGRRGATHRGRIQAVKTSAEGTGSHGELVGVLRALPQRGRGAGWWGSALLCSALWGSIQSLQGPACPAECCRDTLSAKPVPPASAAAWVEALPVCPGCPGTRPTLIGVLVSVLLPESWKAFPHFPVAVLRFPFVH